MNSFYGGQQGQSFKVSTIFNSKVDLAKDLTKRWNSSVNPGEFVFITYGTPGGDSESYLGNRDKDIKAYGNSYNATLWQKLYTESPTAETDTLTGIETMFVSGDYGLGYRLIASLTGNTPAIDCDSAVINADQDPYIEIDLTNLDKPIITFYLPQAQLIDFDPLVVLDADQVPTLKVDESDVNNLQVAIGLPRSQVVQVNENTVALDANLMPDVDIDNTNINNPVLTFKIPQSQVLGITDTIALNVGEAPKVTLDETDINNPVLTFHLPRGQSFAFSEATNAIDANLMPSVTIDRADVNNPIITFNLPRSQVMSVPDPTVLNADEKPSVAYDESDINNPVIKFSLPQAQLLNIQPVKVIGPMNDPKLDVDKTDINNLGLLFSLPRASKFFMGSLLGQSKDVTYTLDTSDTEMEGVIAVGDYYINVEAGFMYQVIGTDNAPLVDVRYVACMQAPLPAIANTNLTPFYYNVANDKYQKREVSVSSEYEDVVEQKGWKLRFNIPNPPSFIPAVEFLGSTEIGSVTGIIQDNENYLYTFKIPQGSKFHTGNLISEDGSQAVVGPAKEGDYYLNTDVNSLANGNVYKLENETWILQGSIKGATGDPLHIISSHIVTADEVSANEAPIVGAHILGILGEPPDPDELVAVTYLSDDTELAYWYYFVKGQWGRVLLTGGISGLIDNEYNVDSDPNKLYSTKYINSLIVSGDVPENDEHIKTFSAAHILELIKDMKETILQELAWGSF